MADFKAVLDSLRDKYDYILVDSPPLLAVSDPLVWSQSVDGVFFVVDVQQTKSDMVQQAADRLKEMEVPILGLVMNRLTRHHNYYYYGYYRKYSYYRKGRAGDKKVKAVDKEGKV